MLLKKGDAATDQDGLYKGLTKNGVQHFLATFKTIFRQKVVYAHKRAISPVKLTNIVKSVRKRVNNTLG